MQFCRISQENMFRSMTKTLKVCLFVCFICLNSAMASPLPAETVVNPTTESNQLGRQANTPRPRFINMGNIFAPLRPSVEQFALTTRQFECGLMTFFGVGDMCPVLLGKDTAPPEGVTPFGGMFQPFQQMFQGVAPAAQGPYASNSATAASPASSGGIGPFGSIFQPLQQMLQGIAPASQAPYAGNAIAARPPAQQNDAVTVNNAALSSTNNLPSVPSPNQAPIAQNIFPGYYPNYFMYGYPWGYYGYPSYSTNYYPQLSNSLQTHRRRI